MAGFIIMGAIAITGSITAGISAAQMYCQEEAQAARIRKQTQQFVEQSSKLFQNLEALDSETMQQIDAVKIQESEAVNTLADMKAAYKTRMGKMQIGVSVFIIIVFMLLLGKKLKIY